LELFYFRRSKDRHATLSPYTPKNRIYSLSVTHETKEIRGHSHDRPQSVPVSFTDRRLLAVGNIQIRRKSRESGTKETISSVLLSEIC
jgi:hypothetical protein